METPALDKIKEVQEQSQAIGEFLEWLTQKKGIVFGKYLNDEEYESEANRYEDGTPFGKRRDHEYSQQEIVPFNVSIEDLLADFFGIDLKRVEEERRKILENIQKKK